MTRQRRSIAWVCCLGVQRALGEDAGLPFRKQGEAGACPRTWRARPQLLSGFTWLVVRAVSLTPSPRGDSAHGRFPCWHRDPPRAGNANGCPEHQLGSSLVPPHHLLVAQRFQGPW